MNLIALTSTNPGIYSAADYDIPGGFVMLGILGIGLIVGGMAAVADDSWPIALSFGVVGLVLAIVGGGNVGQAVEQNRAEANAAETAYTDAVVDWLRSDYGITTSAAVADELVDGKSYAADYDGKQITISIIEAVDGDLAVVDERRTPLTPLAQ